MGCPDMGLLLERCLLLYSYGANHVHPAAAQAAPSGTTLIAKSFFLLPFSSMGSVTSIYGMTRIGSCLSVIDFLNLGGCRLEHQLIHCGHFAPK